MLNFYWVRYLFSFPMIGLPYLVAFVGGFIYGELNDSNGLAYAFVLLVVLQLMHSIPLFPYIVLVLALFEVGDNPDPQNLFFLCLPLALFWEAYINPWYAAMLYVIWFFGCAGNPLAMLLHVIKAYAGLVLYTVGLVITPVVMAFGQALEDEVLIKQDLPTIAVGLAFSFFFIYQRRWILHVRGVLPWPGFCGSDEDFEYLPRKNLPELQDRPFGLF
jgi:hypothetical protein